MEIWKVAFQVNHWSLKNKADQVHVLQKRDVLVQITFIFDGCNFSILIFNIANNDIFGPSYKKDGEKEAQMYNVVAWSKNQSVDWVQRLRLDFLQLKFVLVDRLIG